MGRREKREDLLEVGEVRFLLCRIHRLGGIDSVVLTTYSIPMNRLFPLEVSKVESSEREREERQSFTLILLPRLDRRFLLLKT